MPQQSHGEQKHYQNKRVPETKTFIKIIEFLHEYNRCNLADIHRITGIDKETIKQAIFILEVLEEKYFKYYAIQTIMENYDRHVYSLPRYHNMDPKRLKQLEKLEKRLEFGLT